jgi:hypothetical protein
MDEKVGLQISLMNLKHLLYPALIPFDVDQHHLQPHIHRKGVIITS